MRRDHIDRATAVVLFVLYELGGTSRMLDIEEIAVEAWKRAPDLFGMRHFREHPRLDAAYYPLKNQKARGLVTGGNRRGWMLTEAGFNLVASRVDEFRRTAEAIRERQPDARGEIAREFARIQRTDAFTKFRAGRAGDISESEAVEALRVTLTSPKEVRQQRKEMLLNLCRQFGRPDIAEFIRALPDAAAM
jgi:hypothetical protein